MQVMCPPPDLTDKVREELQRLFAANAEVLAARCTEACVQQVWAACVARLASQADSLLPPAPAPISPAIPHVPAAPLRAPERVPSPVLSATIPFSSPPLPEAQLAEDIKYRALTRAETEQSAADSDFGLSEHQLQELNDSETLQNEQASVASAAAPNVPAVSVQESEPSPPPAPQEAAATEITPIPVELATDSGQVVVADVPVMPEAGRRTVQFESLDEECATPRSRSPDSDGIDGDGRLALNRMSVMTYQTDSSEVWDGDLASGRSSFCREAGWQYESREVAEARAQTKKDAAEARALERALGLLSTDTGDNDAELADFPPVPAEGTVCDQKTSELLAQKLLAASEARDIASSASAASASPPAPSGPEIAERRVSEMSDNFHSPAASGSTSPAASTARVQPAGVDESQTAALLSFPVPERQILEVSGAASQGTSAASASSTAPERELNVEEELEALRHTVRLIEEQLGTLRPEADEALNGPGDPSEREGAREDVNAAAPSKGLFSIISAPVSFLRSRVSASASASDVLPAAAEEAAILMARNGVEDLAQEKIEFQAWLDRVVTSTSDLLDERDARRAAPSAASAAELPAEIPEMF